MISVLGPTDGKAQFVVSAGIKNILLAMKQQGISRLVISAGAAVRHPNDFPNLVNQLLYILARTLSKVVCEDMVNGVKIVRQSAVKRTIVRGPMLADAPESEKIKVAWEGKGLGMQVSRVDLALFMFNQLDDYT